MRKFCLRTAVVLVALLGLVTWGRGEADLAGGTVITNDASLTFRDARGTVYTTLSNSVSVTLAKIAAITVTPKEAQANPATDGVPIGTNVTRTFVIANTSNIPDAYKVVTVNAAPLTIVSMDFITSSGPIPITLDSTVSPTVQPGDSITVQIVLGTSQLTLGASASVSITAETTAESDNGVQSDSGEQWVIGATSSQLSGPSGAGASISKMVDDETSVQSQAASSVTYDIIAKDPGGSPTQNVVVTDTLPTGMTAQLSTVAINGNPAGSAASLNGQVLTVQIGTLDAGASVDVSFQATTPNVQTLGTTYVNTAQVTASGVAPQGTTPASVLMGSADIVYNGLAGSSAPVSGATVTLLDANGNLVQIGGSSSSASSAATAASSASRAPTSTILSDNTQNPMITGSDGAYGFALAPSQIAAGGSKFILEIDAPSYLNRKIALTITPGTGNLLYNVTAVALDDQPIAAAGSFTLIKSAMQLANVFGLFGNVPLFATRAIEVTKTADRSTAQPGDRVQYTIDFSNGTTDPIGATQIIDQLSPGLVFATGTAMLDGVASEPVVDGQTLTWTIAALNPGAKHEITYDGVVYPTVAAGTNLTNLVTVNGNVPGTQVGTTGASSVTVQVIAGALTEDRPITGRVFVDVEHTGHFAKGDKGLAGVRIYMEDGSSVVTDDEGRFDFPSVRPGMHVLRLDATTLPRGVNPYPDQRMNSTHALQQLVHGIMDEGIMDDVEFALEP